MKKLLLILILSVLAGCGGGNTEQDTFSKNLKYLSFWDSGTRVENHHSQEYISTIISDVSKVSNVITISVIGYDYKVANGTIIAIDEAVKNNKKIILIVWNIFFEKSKLRPEYTQIMSIFRHAIVDPYREHILAFYIEDEPFLSIDEPPIIIKNELNKLIFDLKNYYPEIISIVSYSYIELDNDSVKNFPVKSNWVVGNIYYQQLKNSDLVRHYLDSLAAQKEQNQSIVFMMDAFFVGKIVDDVLKCSPSKEEEIGSISFNEASIRWANSNTKHPVVASFVFLYDNTIESSNTVICGATSMPKVLAFIEGLNVR